MTTSNHEHSHVGTYVYSDTQRKKEREWWRQKHAETYRDRGDTRETDRDRQREPDREEENESGLGALSVPCVTVLSSGNSDRI